MIYLSKLPPHKSELNLPQINELRMWEHGKGAGNTILRTTGLGPCIGVAVYNDHTRTGHLAHLPEPRTDKDRVNAFFVSATADTSSPESLQVWVRGGEPGGDPTYTFESQLYIEDLLKTYGLKDVDLEWSAEDTIVNMALDCSNGNCDITVIL